MGMSQSYGAPDEAESIRTIHRALDLGVTFLDTADAYGAGANEVLVGRALRHRRGDAQLATKFGLVPGSTASAAEVDARPERVRACCEASLERLGVSVIDLYYLHRVDPKVPLEDTVGAMSELVSEGKVRFLGLSEVGANSLRRAFRIHPIAALQSEYSLWSRDPELGALQACRELGIGFVPFSPLGRGFLTGAVTGLDRLEHDDVRRSLPRFQGENLGRNIQLVERLREMAKSKACTPPQLALAWLLAKGDDIVPIPGTKRRQYLEANAAAVEITLDPTEVAALNESFPVGSAAGERYPPAAMALVETEQAP
jgi:aryl-alcohol dehydrogenase-like predicted oxidoreductase